VHDTSSGRNTAEFTFGGIGVRPPDRRASGRAWRLHLPRDAFFGRTEPVPAERAAGRAVAEMLTPYPPGIPVAVPGEVSTNRSSTSRVREWPSQWSSPMPSIPT
jgi:hypothetical protein